MRLTRFFLVVLFLVAALAVTRLVLDHVGVGMIEEMSPRLDSAIAAEQARLAAVRFPAPPSGASEGDGAPALGKLLTRGVALGQAFRVEWLLPMDARQQAAADAFLEAHASDLDAIRDAVRATRCDWSQDIATGMEGPMLELMGARGLAHLLALDGQKRRAAQDGRGAAADALAAARLGLLTSTGASLIESMGARGLVYDAWGRLARAVTGTAISAADLREIDAQVAAISAALPGDEDRVRLERLRSAASLRLLSAKSGGAAGAFVPMSLALGRGSYDFSRLPSDLVIPTRYRIGTAMRELSEIYGPLESGLGGAFPQAVSVEAQFMKSVDGVENPMTRMMLANFGDLAERTAHFVEIVRLLRFAIALEIRREAEGRYPDTIADADLPEEPVLAPKRMRYESLDGGARYRIASEGEGRGAGAIRYERTVAR